MSHARRNDPFTPQRELVELKGKLRTRFYEPLVLLLAATQACMHNFTPKVLEPVPDRFNRNSEQLFHDFMNKLAQICDSRPGGTTVTSAVALNFPEHVQYRLASNQRKEVELTTLREFMVDMLQTLREWTEKTTRIVTIKVLRKVVAFNRPRLQVYVKSVSENSATCLATPGLNDAIDKKLHELNELSSSADNRELDEKTFFQRCFLLMDSIKKLSRSSIYRTFRDKANASQAGEVSPWAELRHAAGRLLSYLEGVNTLVEARSVAGWERLFYDVQVVCLPSSRPAPNPIVRKDVTASSILGRMSSTLGLANLESCRRDAEELQRFDLDANILQQNAKESFRPIVHAEILVHESIVNDPDVRDLHASRFFGGYKYIGTSKPTCRLCDYYFRAVNDGVRVRHTHRNLYVNWRAPDVYVDQAMFGEKTAAKRREDILISMCSSIRMDTYRTLSDKVPETKKHDSNTSRTYKRTFSMGYSSKVEEDVDDVASSMVDLGLDD